MFVLLHYKEGCDKLAHARAVNKLSRLFGGCFLISLQRHQVVLDTDASVRDLESRVRHIFKCAGCTITGRADL